jgi:1,4-dihydroxy-2-naphthoate octaprenyltransferase
MTQSIAPWVIWLAVPLGILIAAFLWINEFPDYRADAGAGKRTLVVRLGRRQASRVFAGLVAAAFLFLFASLAWGVPKGALGGLVAVVPAVSAARTLATHAEETPRIVPAQAKTLAAFVVYALGAGMGSMVA